MLAALVPQKQMACCRKGSRHSCCHRKAKTDGTAFSAQSHCGKSCCKAALPLNVTSAAPPRRESQELVASFAPLTIAGTGAPVAAQHRLIRFQRPPPVVSI